MVIFWMGYSRGYNFVVLLGEMEKVVQKLYDHKPFVETNMNIHPNDLSFLKPACSLLSFLSTVSCILSRMIWQRILLGTDRSMIPLQFLHSLRLPFLGIVTSILLVPCKPVLPVSWSGRRRLNWHPHRACPVRRVARNPVVLKTKTIKGRMDKAHYHLGTVWKEEILRKTSKTMERRLG